MSVREVLSVCSDYVFFLTTDLDRASEAINLAASQGLQLEPIFPKERKKLAGAAAVVIDQDYLCLDIHGLRRELASLRAFLKEVPMVFLGYNYNEATDEESPNVAQFQTLTETPFQWLAEQLAQSEPAFAPSLSTVPQLQALAV